MDHNNSWKNIEVEVSVEPKPQYTYVARVINVENTYKHGEPAYKVTYSIRNMNGDELTVAKTVQERFFKNWLSFHNGFDANDPKPLRKIADHPQLIVTSEYNSSIYVAKVIPLDTLKVMS